MGDQDAGKVREGMAKARGKKATASKSTSARKKPAKRRAPKRASSKETRQPAKRQTPVDPASVRLEEGKGSAGRGGGPGGHYWHIFLSDTRAGYVYINVIDEAPFGKHASIQIHINQSQRSRGIGSVAYRLACEQSGHEEVIATMRKSNVASQRAATQAGFKVIDDLKLSQMAMRWKRG